MALDFQPITPTLGAYVRTTPEDAVGGETPGQILEALNRYNVLVFPKLGMSDELFLRLTAAMGEKHDSAVTADGSEASNKGIFRIALDKDSKTQREFILANDFWHIDGMSYTVPVKATLLKCQHAPREGGDTGFASLHAAWEALPEAKKAQLKVLRVGHCLSASVGRLYETPTEEDYARWDAIFPRLERPLVWTQNNGKSSLLIGSTANDIAGMSHEAGRALLHELLAWCTQDRFCYRHKWSDGDLVIFNNPALLHRSYPYTDAAGRVMHRTTLKGAEAIGKARRSRPTEGEAWMVLERAEIFIADGRMEEFLEVLRTQAIPLTAQFTGCLSFRALRGVEDANSVMFLAEWESIEAHLASRPEPAHEEFRRIVLPYTTGARQTVHFEPV